MVAGIVVEYLRPILAGIKPAELAAAPASVQSAIHTMNLFVNGLRVGNFEVPALVAVAVLGIALNLVLNWSEILDQASQPAPARVGEAGAEALPA